MMQLQASLSHQNYICFWFVCLLEVFCWWIKWLLFFISVVDRWFKKDCLACI